MNPPVCPPNYECVFRPKPPPHYWAHWWDGPWGQWVTILAIIALAIVLGLTVVTTYDHITDRRRDKAREREDERLREHELAIEQQRTMQLDAAQGNLEMLKLIRDQA